MWKIEFNNAEKTWNQWYGTEREAENEAIDRFPGDQWVIVEVENGEDCGNCGGSGKVWEQNGPDDGNYEVCECCDGRGKYFKSEWERDRHNGRL